MDNEERDAGPKIFISYRIADTGTTAGPLAEQLCARFGLGADDVFLDTSTIHPGDPWPSRIEQAVRGAEVVLVLIGEQWLDVRDRHGGNSSPFRRTEARFELPHPNASNG